MTDPKQLTQDDKHDVYLHLASSETNLLQSAANLKAAAARVDTSIGECLMSRTLDDLARTVEAVLRIVCAAHDSMDLGGGRGS